jgi:transcriptional regulator with XRE-family HTH domain
MTHTFGARLVTLRDRLGMTQKDMCELAGIDRKTQSAYENDKRYPDAEYLIALLQHGFDVLYLLTGKETAYAGLINENLLRDVLIAVEDASTRNQIAIESSKKATVVALVYQASCIAGHIDPALVDKAVRLAG